MSTWSHTRYGLKLATDPAVEPLTYAQAKAWLRLPDDTDKTFVEALIASARHRVEQDTGRVLITQAWDLSLDEFPSDAIYVPVEPLISVTSIKTTTLAGVESTLAAANYQVDTISAPPRILLADAGTWPSDIRAASGIVIRLSCGYGAAASAVPPPLIRAMEQLIAHWYLHRSSTIATPLAPPFQYTALIQPYRLSGIA
jgi:uncharacterized phiE125 gp8 family phage protein